MVEKTSTIRRRFLKALGGGIVAGSLGTGVSSASGGGSHWANGAELVCTFNTGSVFNSIYNDVKDWENSFVGLSHPDWSGNIRIRIGDVLRVSNEDVLDTWDYYYEQGNGSDELGDNAKIICCGTWGSSDNHLWSYTHHIGRVNGIRAGGSQNVAEKYWYHEVGHGHTLGHRYESGALMNPNSPLGMSMNSSETSQWYDVYDSSATLSKGVKEVSTSPPSTEVIQEHTQNKDMEAPTVEFVESVKSETSVAIPPK